MKTLLLQLRDLLLDIFFPKHCVGCGKEGQYLCYECADKIEKIQTPTCPECGRINGQAEFCPKCKKRLKTSLDGLIVGAIYQAGPVKEMIHQLKYDKLLELAPMLGQLIVERLRRRCPAGQIVVIPVPLHRDRQKQRGFNQSELLARYISQELGFPGGLALARVRQTVPQVSLSGEKRRQNLTGAFKVSDPELVSGKTVLLVDDVATTLSTLNECAKALKGTNLAAGSLPKGGAKKVWGVVVSRG